MAPAKAKKSSRAKSTARKTTARKSARKTTARKTARKSTARKTARKTTARKTVRKSTAKKSVRKSTAKTTAKKTAGKSTARKTARKSTARRAGGRKTKSRSKSKARILKPGTILGGRASKTTIQQFSLVSRLVARAFTNRLGPKGIGYGQLPVLLCLWEEDGITQKTLSERIRIEAPTMVRTLDRMERDGLVERVRSKTDRRRIHINLSAKARRLKSVLSRLSGEVDRVALAGLNRSGKKTLSMLLDRLVLNLERDATLNI